jgi:phytoene desaturase
MRVNPVHLPVLFRSFYSQVKKYFDSQEARQIISLVAFFLGRTPFDTMAVSTACCHILNSGTTGTIMWKEACTSIVEGLLNELKKEGVPVHYHTEITGFAEDNGKIGI